MDTSFSALLGLARDCIADPRAGARRLIRARPSMNARWIGMALVLVLTVLLGQITLGLMLGPARLGGGLLPSLLLQAVVLMGTVGAVQVIGRMMGGRGSFPDALLLVAFLQGIMLIVQLVQIAALLLLPPVAGVLGFLGFGVFLWVLTGFVAELHGFRSLPAVFGMILVTALGAAFLAALLLAMLGFEPPAWPGQPMAG